MTRGAVKETKMNNTYRKIGITTASGDIKFVSREEGHRNLRKSAKLQAVRISEEDKRNEIAVKRGPCL